MSTTHIQVLGLTRWSYPFSGAGFRRSGEDLAALRARLYAPARLDHRLFLLEHVVLPALRVQRDTDFTHLFLIGDHLPDPWRSRVMRLLADVPQIAPVIRPEGEMQADLCREVLRAHVDPGCDVVAQYRLDDDDGLARNFVLQTRRMFEQIAPMFEEEGRFGLDFNRGFILQSSRDDIAMRPVSMRFWAPGLVVFQRPDSKRALLDFPHLRLWHAMPTLSWNGRPMFIRGAHHDNDSVLANFARRTRSFRFSPANPERYWRNHFGVDLPAMQEIWRREKAHFFGAEEAGEVRRPAA